MKRVLIHLLAACFVVGPLGLVVTPPTPVVIAAAITPEANAPLPA